MSLYKLSGDKEAARAEGLNYDEEVLSKN